MDIPYPQRIRKMVMDYADIMEKLLEGPIGEEDRVFNDSPKLDVTLKEGDDDAPQASWMEKGNKR